MLIDRKTILARLSCSGFKPSNVTITGADKIEISQSSNVLKEDRIVSAAKQFLTANMPSQNICDLKAIHLGGDLRVDSNIKDLKLKCSKVAGTSSNYAKVKVRVFDGEKFLCEKNINFRLKFKVTKAIAKENVELGERLTADKYEMKEVISDYPARYKSVKPEGLVAKRKLVKGMEIKPEMLQAKTNSVVIKRNKDITVRVEKYGFSLSLIAKALEDGTDGDLIRVRNIDSNKIITVKINPDGTASPVIL